MESLESILNGYRLWKRVALDGQHPEVTSLGINMPYLRAIGIWPSKTAKESYFRRIFNALMTVALVAFLATITCDLYDASSDFITFGDDLCVLIGLSLIMFKAILYRVYRPNIEAIAEELEIMQRKFAKGSKTIRRIQKSSFIQEVLIFYTFAMLGNVLFAAVGFQPLISGQARTLPFRAKFPFSIADKRVFAAVYIFQCVCTLVNIKSIVYIDNLGCNVINQTSVNLKILCERIRSFSRERMSRRDLGDIISDHQRIIRLIESTNKYFYLNYVSQMGASTFLICLTAFEAQLAHDQPMVALKFLTYMFSLFMQLFYWCWVGNKVRFDSLEVATAAYECEWLSQSKELRRDLMFVIKRAQKPLAFRAQPLYGYDFQSFASILSSSYSYFTLLRTLND